MVYNIYAFGNSQLMTAMMQGMAALTSSSMYSTAVLLALIVGFIFTTIKMMSVNSGRASVLGKHVLLCLVFCTAGISQTVTVNIQNLNGTQPHNVDHVPFAVAATAWLMSSIGYNFAKAFDQAYSGISTVPQSLLASSGIPMGASNEFILAANNYRLQDQHLAQSIRYWITDCVPPAIMQNQTSMADLYQAPKLLDMLGATIAGTSEGTHTLYYGADTDKNFCTPQQANAGDTNCKSAQGSFVTCKDAYQAIKSNLKNQSSSMVNNFLYEATSGLSSELFNAVIKSNIAAKGYSPTAGEYLQQSALMKILSGMKYDIASRINDQVMMQEFAIAKAQNATISSWTTQSSVFQSTFGYIFALIQIMLYAISPLILLFTFLGGFGLNKLKNWFLLMLWIPVTFIMIVLIQAISSTITQDYMQGIVGHMNGFNLNSVDYISAKAQMLLASAHNMETVAPLFAVSLIFGGSMAITSFLSHTGSATFGASAGGEAASGNASADNISLRNARNDQAILSQSISTGSKPVQADISSGTPMIANDFGGQSNKLNNASVDIRENFDGKEQGSQLSNNSQSVSQGGSLQESTVKQHDYTKTSQFGGQTSSNLGVNADLGSLLKGGGALLGEGVLGKVGMAASAGALISSDAVAKTTQSSIEMGENILSAMNVTGANASQKASVGSMLSQYNLATEKGDTQAANAIQDEMSAYINSIQSSPSPRAQNSKKDDTEVLWDRGEPVYPVNKDHPLEPIITDEANKYRHEEGLTDMYPVFMDIAGMAGLAKATYSLGKLGIEYGMSKLGKEALDHADDIANIATKAADDFPYGNPVYPHGKLPEPKLVEYGEYVPFQSSVKFSDELSSLTKASSALVDDSVKAAGNVAKDVSKAETKAVKASAGEAEYFAYEADVATSASGYDEYAQIVQGGIGQLSKTLPKGADDAIKSGEAAVESVAKGAGTSTGKGLSELLGVPKLDMSSHGAKSVADGVESAAKGASKSSGGYGVAQVTKTSSEVAKEAEAVAEVAGKSGIKGWLGAAGGAVLGGVGVNMGLSYRYEATTANSGKDNAGYQENAIGKDSYQDNTSLNNQYGKAASHTYTMSYTTSSTGGGNTLDLGEESKAENLWREQEAVNKNQLLTSQMKEKYDSLNQRIAERQLAVRNETDKGIGEVNEKSDAWIPFDRGDKPSRGN